MRWVFLVILVCISAVAAAQYKIQIEGVIRDSESGEPIPGAHIWSKEMRRGAYSKKDGSYSLKSIWKPGATLKITSIGYTSKTIDLNRPEGDGKTALNIELSFDPVALGIADVTGAPDTVYSDKEYHVADYCFTDQGMILLTYDKEERWKRQEDSDRTLYKNCKLVLLDEFDREIDNIKLDYPASYFHTGYLDEVFLISDSRVDHIAIQNDDLILSDVPREDFEDMIRPIVDSIGSQVFVTNYAEDFPAFEYYVHDKTDSSYQTLRYVVDKPLMELFRSEYKYLSGRGKLEAFRHEMKTGIDKEIVAAYMTGFANSLYYEELYAPLYVVDDTVMVFDHYSDQIYKYISPDQLADSVSIDYHKPKKRKEWQKEILRDFASSTMFGLFKRNGYCYLKQIDVHSGEAVSSFKLLHRYVEHIRVRDGWAYYVYRPFESSQKKYLYKEQIVENAAP